jgi:hypothetical protein
VARDGAADASAGPTVPIPEATPAGTGVRGILDVTEKEFASGYWFLLRADGSEVDLGEVGGLRAPGPFHLEPPEQGEYELMGFSPVARGMEGERRWSSRRFAYRGAAIDLGTIRLEAGVSLRARWSSKARDVPDGARLEVARVFAEGPDSPLWYRRRAGKASLMTPHGQEAGEEDGKGWTVFKSLVPGGAYTVLSSEMPALRETVVLPEEPGATVSVEVAGALVLVPCTIRFTIEGKEPAFWSEFRGPAYADEFRTSTGTLEASLPVGRHRVRIRAAPGPEPDYEQYFAEFDVPAGTSWVTTVDLRPLRPREVMEEEGSERDENEKR